MGMTRGYDNARKLFWQELPHTYSRRHRWTKRINLVNLNKSYPVLPSNWFPGWPRWNFRQNHVKIVQLFYHLHHLCEQWVLLNNVSFIFKYLDFVKEKVGFSSSSLSQSKFAAKKIFDFFQKICFVEAFWVCLVFSHLENGSWISSMAKRKMLR